MAFSQLQLCHYCSKPTSSILSKPRKSPILSSITNTRNNFSLNLSINRTFNPIKMPNISSSPSKNDTNYLYKTHNDHRLRNRVATKIRDSSELKRPATLKKNTQSIVFWSFLSVTLSVANRVFYKLALVPLKYFPFFLAQFITFGYVAIYFAILFVRHRAGIVTDEMLAVPKSRFLFIGFLEALGLAAGMASAAMIPGPAISLLQQVNYFRNEHFWSGCYSTVFLGRRYTFLQIVGCLLVAAGVVIAVSSGSAGGQVLSGVPLIWPALMVSSGACHAGASILKKFVFVDAAARLKDKSLDVFVVNSFGSGFQALFVLLLLPVLSNLKGIPFPELPMYLKSGAACFLNFGGVNPGCDGAPLLPLLYVGSNIAFNISSKKCWCCCFFSRCNGFSANFNLYPFSSTAISSTKCESGLFFVIGSVILMSGLVLYNLPQTSQQRS